MTDMIVKIAEPILLAMLTAFVALAFRLVRQLPIFIKKFGEELKRQAQRTDNPLDDVAANLLIAFAEALGGAIKKELPKAKKK